ncbi:MAG: TRAP transporter small permease [Oscillospiraceae bacterium]
MKALEKIKKYVSVISRYTGYVSYIGYALIILLTVVDVVLRKTINKPIVGGYEIIQYLLLVSVFASFAYCQTLRGHIQVTMILRHLPKRAVFVIYTITSLLTTAVMAFVAYAAAQQALYCMERGFVSDTLKFATYPFIWIECVCMAIFALVCFVDVIQSAYAIFNTELQEQLLEEWD